MRDRDRGLGAYIGAAIGDAMGGPVECNHAARIKRLVGKITGLLPYERPYTLIDLHPGYALRPDAGAVTDADEVGDGDRHEDSDDHDHDHQLDQSEASRSMRPHRSRSYGEGRGRVRAPPLPGISASLAYASRGPTFYWLVRISDRLAP